MFESRSALRHYNRFCLRWHSALVCYGFLYGRIEWSFRLFFSRAEKNQKAMGASEIRGDGLPTSGGAAELASLRHRRPCLRPYGAPA